MRKLIAKILRWQARKYVNNSQAKVVAVTGSVGKTSTTQAIAAVLSQKFTVRKTLHNYNTDVGVPCSIFAIEIPSNVKNPFAWAVILLKNQFKLLTRSNIHVFVLELGTDAIGEIDQFQWLQPDINVVTAVAPEHMEQFGSIDAVAKEELSATHYSQAVLINKHMVDPVYYSHADTDEMFLYDRDDVGRTINTEELQVVGRHSYDAVAAALKVAEMLNLPVEEQRSGALLIQSQKGRMNKLRGIKNSILIDDTYNSSPEAVIAALNYAYETPAVQKIAVLGNMNELGETSEMEHTAIGAYCQGSELDLVVTLGPDANKFTASAAEKNGCNVVRANTPYEVSEKIKAFMQPGALVLVKGSQNNVYAEEVTKKLLQNPEDEVQLVRQSPSWMKKKIRNFESIGS